MIATNAFKQAVVGTYTASDTVIELNSISDTVGASDYLPNGGFNLILYDGLFGNPADANNAGDYEILECSSVNYATNEITVVRGVENTTAVTIDASSWQVVYGATVEFFAQFEDADATILKQADVVDTLVSTSVIAPLSANQGKQLEDTKIPTADIINDLTTGGATKVLSAEQGVVLKGQIEEFSTKLYESIKSDTTVQSVAARPAIGGTVADLTLEVTTLADDKVLVSGFVTIGGASTDNTLVHLFRGSTEIGRGDIAGDRQRAHSSTSEFSDKSTAQREVQSVPFNIVDEPTAGTHTYSVRFSHFDNTSHNIYINRSVNDADSNARGRYVSVITAQKYK